MRSEHHVQVNLKYDTEDLGSTPDNVVTALLTALRRQDSNVVDSAGNTVVTTLLLPTALLQMVYQTVTTL